MSRYYRLSEDGKTPVALEGDEAVLANAEIGLCLARTGFNGNFETTEPTIQISTIFLAINHQYGDGPPILFETMIFGGIWREYQERYSTYDKAMKGHARAVRLVINERIYTRLAKLRECDISDVIDVPYFAAADCLREAGEIEMADEIISGGW